VLQPIVEGVADVVIGSLLNCVLVFEHGIDPVELGLSKPDDREHAYIQCVDPGAPYTQGGTVVFKIRRIAKEKFRE